MKDIYKKVVGYFAVRKGTPSLLCDGESSVIAGSERAMWIYITMLASGDPRDYRIIIKKAKDFTLISN